MSQQRGKWQESIKGLLVPIESLDEDPVNARLHSDRNLDSIRESLNRFGQTKPIVSWVTNDNRPIVIAGNGTFRSAKALGWTHIASARFEGTEAEARAYALVDNRSAELAQWDQTRLIEHVEGIGKDWEQSPADVADWAGFDLHYWDASTEPVASEYQAPTAAASIPTPPERQKKTPPAAPAASSFPLIVQCRTADERKQIKGELEKHGIPCEAIR